MIKYIFLGIVQGLTEFLPVSSSGHLVIIQKIMGLGANQVAISVIMHLGTVLAVIIFFRKDILNLLKNPRLFGLACVVVIITGVIGVSAKDFFEGLFSSAKAVGIAWLFTGLILISTRRLTRLDRDKLKLKDALILGMAQGLAIIPGVSRSGITISALFYRKIERRIAFAFSFLVSIPVILGVAVLEARKLEAVPRGDIKNLAVGFICSFLSGLFALLFLRSIINKSKFYYFGYYCLFMATLTLLFIK
ncbi:MAG: undecaprenyl-diphosphate phosphatase [Candidatus Omnitrophica bacterium]|nr:undecaprenyl-diphosphate phosphatase [Candidatus Omnitrophota bacterium]MDD5690807.1 undecaprenyl-diphosphate phosphatase [Candidatus Omnitrophota bacterium]